MLSISGCRGIVGASLTPEVIARYCGAAAQWLTRGDGSGGGRQRIVFARDGRAGGEPFRRIVLGSLAAAGLDVADLDIATTPTAGVMVRHLRAAGAVVLTASHNPGEWNGLKVIGPDGAAPDAAQAGQLLDLYRAGVVRLASPAEMGVIEADQTAAYVHTDRVLYALSRVASVEALRSARFRIVLDSVNASGRIGGRMLLGALGCELVHIGCEDTGIFPHPPEPTEEHLRSLCDAVRRERAAVGFAQDPDADRLAIVDENGRYIGEEYTLALAALSVLSSMSADDARAATLAANLSTSRMIDDVASCFGARVIRTPVGEANVRSAMDASGALVGGEGNGGVIWPAVVPIRDSLGAMALVLALMSREKKPLSAIVDALPRYAIRKRKTPIRDGLAQRAMGAVETCYPGAAVDRQDGARVDFPAPSGGGAAWLHVRASNTEPILRLIAEAPTEADAEAILDEAERAIERS